jgi:hypothetical protein
MGEEAFSLGVANHESVPRAAVDKIIDRGFLGIPWL